MAQTTDEWLASYSPGVDWWTADGRAIRLRKRLIEAGLPTDQGLDEKDLLNHAQEEGRKRMCERLDLPENSSWVQIHTTLVFLRRIRDFKIENGTWEGSIFDYF